MRLAFLFLPYVGLRDYSTYQFHVSGPRFDMKHTRFDSCIACLYSNKINVQNVIDLGKHDDGTPRWTEQTDTRYKCTLNLSHKGTKVFSIHPCSKFTHPYRLKKL